MDKGARPKEARDARSDNGNYKDRHNMDKGARPKETRDAGSGNGNRRERQNTDGQHQSLSGIHFRIISQRWRVPLILNNK